MAFFTPSFTEKVVQAEVGMRHQFIRFFVARCKVIPGNWLNCRSKMAFCRLGHVLKWKGRTADAEACQGANPPGASGDPSDWMFA